MQYREKHKTQANIKKSEGKLKANEETRGGLMGGLIKN